MSPAAIELLRERGIRYTRQEWADALGLSLQALLDIQHEHDVSVMAAVPGDHVRQPRRHARRVADLRAALAAVGAVDVPDQPEAKEQPEQPHLSPTGRPIIGLSKVRRERTPDRAPDVFDDPEGFMEWRLRLIGRIARRIRAEEQGEDLEEVRFG